MRCRRAVTLSPMPKQIGYVTDRPGHDFRYALAIDKAGTALDWRPQTAFDEGFAATIAWYLENRAWCAGITEKLLCARAAGRHRLMQITAGKE